MEKQDDTRANTWEEAFRLWKDNLRTDNTRRAYQRAWDWLIEFTGLSPWQINRSDVMRWIETMRESNLSKCTIAQRLAAISSFYTFATTDYTVINKDRNEEPLHHHNPAAGRSMRPKINPYGKSIYMTPAQVRDFLSKIPRDTVKGLRDLALFLGYLFTGRRNSEWRSVCWGDFTDTGANVYYRWSGKGKYDQRAELPPPVWKAIRTYLVSAGRWGKLQDQDYIFTAVNRDPDKPLSMREAGRALKQYCRLAGLDAEKIHVHTLRHSAAMLRKEAGDDIETICRMLSHSTIAVTQIYLHTLEGLKDTSWSRVETLLGL